MMTIKTAKEQAKGYGMTIKRDPDTREFMVYPIGTKNPGDHPGTYFTDDLQDAVDTARFIPDPRRPIIEPTYF